MKTLKINEENLREVVENTIIKMENCGWNGWKSTIYSDENGNLSVSDCHSGNIILHKDFIGLIDIEYWNFNEEDFLSKHEQIQYDTDWYIDNFKHELEFQLSTEIYIELK